MKTDSRRHPALRETPDSPVRIRVARVALALAFVGALATTPPGAASQTLSLSAALDSAFATHPALSRARARQAGAAEGASAARATRWPTLGLDLSLNHFSDPMITTPIHAFDQSSLPAFDETLVQGTLGLRYTLLDWGGRSSGIDGSDSEVAMAAAAGRATSVELIQLVTGAYLRVSSSRAIDAAAVARVTALEAEEARVRRALAAGTAAEVEVLRASVALQDAWASRTTTRGSVLLSERTLARLIGSTAETVIAATLPDVDPGSTVRGDPPASADQPINPLLEQATYRTDAARTRISGQKAGRYPRLDLTGALRDYGTLTDKHVLEWQAGVQLSWSIFSGGGRSASIRRAEADLLAAESDLAAIELDLDTKVDAAMTAIEAADARVDALQASLGQWEELVRIELLALEAGAGTQRDLLEAEAGLFQARAGHVGARSDAVMARVRLAGASGALDRQWITDMTGESE